MKCSNCLNETDSTTGLCYKCLNKTNMPNKKQSHKNPKREIECKECRFSKNGYCNWTGDKVRKELSECCAFEPKSQPSTD